MMKKLLLVWCLMLAFFAEHTYAVQYCPEQWNSDPPNAFQRKMYELINGSCIPAPPKVPARNNFAGIFDPQDTCDYRNAHPTQYRRCISIAICESKRSKFEYEMCMSDVR